MMSTLLYGAEWVWLWLRMSLVVAPAEALDLCLAPGSCADREGRWLIALEGTVAGIINGCRINLFSLVGPLVWATLVAGRFFSWSGAPWQLVGLSCVFLFISLFYLSFSSCVWKKIPILSWLFRRTPNSVRQVELINVTAY